MRKAMLAGVVVAVLAPISPAIAQPTGQEAVFVNVNGGYQPTTLDFHETIGIRQYLEDAAINTDYRVKAAPAFDVSGGARLWRNVFVGIGVSRFSKSNSAAVTATIPHPFFFNRGRDISGESSQLTREENAVHLQAVILVPLGERFRAALSGGPSFFRVKQDLVQSVVFSETYPYDSATFTRAEVERQSQSNVGFNVGADIAYMFSKFVGAGAFVRFSRTSLEFESADGERFSVNAGGPQVGGGLRLRF